MRIFSNKHGPLPAGFSCWSGNAETPVSYEVQADSDSSTNLTHIKGRIDQFSTISTCAVVVQYSNSDFHSQPARVTLTA